MDADRFESLLRSLAASPSRRTALRLLAGSAVGSLFTLGAREADAHDALKKCKKKSGKQKKKCIKKSKAHNATHTGACTRNCAGKSCGDDGCGGSCGSCVAPETCQSGQCRCTPECHGKTCGDDGCGGSCGACTGGTCDAGQCICSKPFEEVVCQGACVEDCQATTQDRLLDPETCRCCLKHGEECGGGSKPCCSGTCRIDPVGGNDRCEGRNGGEPCTWHEQCRTGFCDAGTCACDGGYCDGVCRSFFCFPECTRNWETCGCCRRNGVSCGGGSHDRCCSGTCDSGTCRGRTADALCTFDAQCASGRCDYSCSNNICTAEKVCV